MLVQYAIPFAIEPDYSPEALIPHVGIRAAQIALDNPQSWNAPVLILSGPPAGGKSHLAAQLGPEVITWDLTTAPLDNQNTAERLFHTINEVHALEEGRLLITSRTHPNLIYPFLPDLDSRLRAAIHIEIKNPDEEEIRQAILFKMCADYQIKIDIETSGYILTRLPQSLHAARIFCERALQAHPKSGLSKIAAKPLIEEVQAYLGERVESSNIFDTQDS